MEISNFENIEILKPIRTGEKKFFCLFFSYKRTKRSHGVRDTLVELGDVGWLWTKSQDRRPTDFDKRIFKVGSGGFT
jgi:hypothetical protein